MEQGMINRWPANPVILEINTWVWLRETSSRHHRPLTLATLPSEAWDEIAAWKPDAVWLMGVWERSPAGIDISNRNEGNLADFRRALPDFTPADNAGSPYCIRNYCTDAALGGDEGLAVAREQLRRRGIRLILDFVPNHLAHDHPWVEQHPEFFLSGSREELLADPVTFTKRNDRVFACGKDPYYPAWQDVLQVNAFNPEFRNATAAVLRKIAGQCDGIRCDMAMLLMNGIFRRTWGDRAGTMPAEEFWTQLIREVKRDHPSFIFLAEAYWETEWDLLQQGFDFCYDKRLYDRLEKSDAASIRQHLAADTGYQEKMVRFIENHDEPRHVTSFPGAKARAAALAFATLPGARLFHEGQMEGRRVRLPVFLRRRPAEPADHALSEFYDRLLRLLSQPMFHQGTWTSCLCEGWPDNNRYEHILAWRWDDGADHCLIVINYSGETVQGHVRQAVPEMTQEQVLLDDPLNDQRYLRQGCELSNLYVELAPWHFHCFLILPA